VNKAQASMRAIEYAERTGAGRRRGSLGY
jgi:hypothetical protein